MNRFYLFSIAAATAVSAAAMPSQSLMKSKAQDFATSPALGLHVGSPSKDASSKVSKGGAETSWGEWEMAGTGTLILDSAFDDFLGMPEWTGEFPDVNVYVRSGADDADAVQYRLDGVFNNVEMIIDCDAATNICKVLPQSTGIEFYEDVMIQVADLASCFELYGREWLDLSEEEVREVIDYYAQYNYYVPELGRFYITLGYFVEGIDDLIALGNVTFQLDGVEDMSVSVEAQPFYKDASDMKARVSFGDAVGCCRYGCFSGILTQDKINAVLDGGDGIKQLTGSSEVDLIETDGNGMYTVVAVTFSADGEPLEWDYAEYTYSSSSHEGWTLLGKGLYTSDMFESLFGEEEVSYEVDVERSDLNPDIIRIVNPYGSDSPYYSDPYVDCVKDYDVYLLFDLSDPDRVTFKPTNLGVDYGGGWWIAVGTACFMELQGNAISPDMYGSLKDGVLSFPEYTVLCTCDHMDELGGKPGMWYYGNHSGALSLTIPDSTSVEGMAEAAADPEYYDMQGIRVFAPAKGSVVIERRGAAVTRKMVR